MMRKLWIVIVLLLLAGGIGLLVARLEQQPWTTDSREAREAFEKGLDARMKLYGSDAKEQFQRALELDPDFTAAKLALLVYDPDKEEHPRLLQELEAAPLAGLSPRERFMVTYRLALEDERVDDASRILADYSSEYPEDPFALFYLAGRKWEEKDWDEAERLYRRLLEVAPNWVLAQNHLGYMAMAQGRFEEAEERFRTYRFIAPDQANPHDSMGELLTTRGRYEEARQELEQALAIKPDFCPSYWHLVDLEVLEGRPARAEPVLERAAAHCSKDFVARQRCVVRFWQALFEGRQDAPWQEEEAECLELLGSKEVVVHRMAVLTGRLEEALEGEQHFRDLIESKDHPNPVEKGVVAAVLSHMQGVREAIGGDFDAAAESFRKADKNLNYWGQDLGILKLFNLVNLAFALEEAGQAEAAAAVLDRVSAVNPRFVEFSSEIRREMEPAGRS